MILIVKLTSLSGIILSHPRQLLNKLTATTTAFYAVVCKIAATKFEKLGWAIVACIFLGFAIDTFAATASEVVAAYERPAIILTWEHANQREDGSALALEEIAGYKLYYSVNAGEEQSVSLPATTSHTITDSQAGRYAFQISTVAEVEGKRSDVVYVDIPSAAPLFPILRITLESCNSAGDCVSEVVQ